MTNRYLAGLNYLTKIKNISYRYAAVALFCGGVGIGLGTSFARFEAS